MTERFVPATDADKELLRKKEACMTENSKMEATSVSDTNNNHHQDNQCNEDFFDTGFQLESPTQRKHRQTSGAKMADDNEPLVVYSEENSSITRTVRDQFAVALLKLQTDLDATGRRLNELESAVRKSTSFNQSTRSNSGSPSSPGGKWQSGNMIQILYLGWPMIVYITMRYMERRSFANKLT